MKKWFLNIIIFNGRKLCCTFAFILLASAGTVAQEHSKLYTVRNGQMFIQLSKHLNESSIDSFINQYDLHELALKNFIKTGFNDSLKKYGWNIAVDNVMGFIITKPIGGSDNLSNPVDKLLFTEKLIMEQFAPVNNEVKVGFNIFKNKNAFRIQNDSIVIFFHRGSEKAREVILSGSFNNWDPQILKMSKTDSGWIAAVTLRPGKYWYKFVVDGNWTTDRDNQIIENDGRGNNNSVYFKPNKTFNLPGYLNAKRVYVAGSFNQWNPRGIPMSRSGSGWQASVYLAQGTHTYRFVVDGHWMYDPNNPDRLPNEFNDFNSVVRVGKPYIFYLKGYEDTKQVVLTGSFNNWRTDELFMKKTATGWELPYTLGPGNYEYRFRADDKWVTGEGNPASEDNQGNSFFIIEPNYTFRLKGFDNAKTVYLAGDFNNWSPKTFAMKREGNDWILRVHLYPGKHLYKFVVDGEWIIDPANKLWEQNEHSSRNSILWFEK
jgi:hypothetical protein